MRRVVLVGMSITEANQRDALHARASAEGASVAFLQVGEPSLVAELTRLTDTGATHIHLEAVDLGTRRTARSWLRRVAAHWLRQRDDSPVVTIGESEVTGTEAPLVSPAWQDVPSHARHVLVCRGPRCSARGADRTSATIDLSLNELGLGDDDVLVTQTGCLFPCNNAPVVVVHPDDVWYGSVDEAAARRIVVEHLQDGAPVADHRLPRSPGRPG
ncbi:(2Fe-2S) ferredoxin domain-containing protein [Aeromicrobium sp. UC242_57]|uniref:(2Fe-2S) ferredoxin domain-containing protein n=1 Tax=Aeromicrobium sp. UC242_57 TaxID=3374624 RepID=UPI00379DC12A